MKTVFLRVLEATDKRSALAKAVAEPSPASTCRYEVETATFGAIPKSPFAYWVKDCLRSRFVEMQPCESDGRTMKQGLVTTVDFRFLRLWWEPRTRSAHSRWFPFAKGGAFSPVYADIYLHVDWLKGGAQSWAIYQARRDVVGGIIKNPDHYFRPGLTWPRRTNGLSLRVMPRGCIFADKGPAAFVEGDDHCELLALAAVTNSAPFGALVSLQLARTELAQSYEVGLIQQTPVPDLDSTETAVLADLARSAWALRRGLDTRVETSHAFVLPAVVQYSGETLRLRADAWTSHASEVEARLEAIHSEIDDRCYALYGISDVDRSSIERGFGSPEAQTRDETATGDDDEVGAEVDAGPMVASLLSWSAGVSFGRFDVRVATVERRPPEEPEPFDSLPVCSPGMLTHDDGLPLEAAPAGYAINFPADGVLVDDPGHPRDFMAAARAVFAAVFAQEADVRWQEAAELVGARKGDLRDSFARTFFAEHLKQYSKSRRKAPIYWQFATPSASYSVWLYCHRLTRDTFFKVLNNYVTPKLQHEESKLTNLVQAIGPNPSRSQGKELAKQETFVDELRAFRDEVARVAPLWNPDLDDGIVLVKAPLWRLVPQHKPWQKELKKKWDELQEGKYDWAHIAMHLWPERVVPKCAEDRSLAIAHDLEDVFWCEDDASKWHPREVDEALVAALVEERTSPTVKDALQKLLDAPAPAGKKKRRRKK